MSIVFCCLFFKESDLFLLEANPISNNWENNYCFFFHVSLLLFMQNMFNE